MKYYTAKELAEKLGVSEKTVRRWGLKGVIETIQPEGKGCTIRYAIKVKADV